MSGKHRRTPTQAKQAFIDFVESKNGKILGIYVRGDVNVEVECECGEKFLVSPAKCLSRKTWCKSCGQKRCTIRETKMKFEKAVFEREGKILEVYKGTHIPILVECKCGNQWEIFPGNLIYKNHWCGNCAGNALGCGKEKFMKIVEDKGGKVIGEYVLNHQALLIECDKGHFVMIRPDNVVQGVWCSVCCNNHVPTAERKFLDIVEDRESLLLEKYNGAFTPVLIECRKGHQVYIMPHNAKSGSWCGTCKESKGEREIRLFLEKRNIKYIPQFYIRTEYGARFYDFYLPDYNTFIEYDGEQHFLLRSFFNKGDTFETRRGRDLEKNKYAKDNDISLLRIPYWLKDEISYILKITLRCLDRKNSIQPMSRYFSLTKDSNDGIIDVFEN